MKYAFWWLSPSELAALNKKHGGANSSRQTRLPAYMWFGVARAERRLRTIIMPFEQTPDDIPLLDYEKGTPIAASCEARVGIIIKREHFPYVVSVDSPGLMTDHNLNMLDVS